MVQNAHSEEVATRNANHRDSIQRVSYERSVENINMNYDLKTKELRDAYDLSSIALKNRYDTSTTNIIRTLAEYGLKYDAAKDTIENLVRNTTIPTPVLQLDPSKELKIVDSTGGEYVFETSHRSSDASSTNYNVITHYVYATNNDYILYGGNFNTFPEGMKLGKDQVWHTRFSTPRNLKYIFLLLEGNYTNF